MEALRGKMPWASREKSDFRDASASPHSGNNALENMDAVEAVLNKYATSKLGARSAAQSPRPPSASGALPVGRSPRSGRDVLLDVAVERALLKTPDRTRVLGTRGLSPRTDRDVQVQNSKPEAPQKPTIFTTPATPGIENPDISPIPIEDHIYARSYFPPQRGDPLESEAQFDRAERKWKATIFPSMHPGRVMY